MFGEIIYFVFIFMYVLYLVVWFVVVNEFFCKCVVYYWYKLFYDSLIESIFGVVLDCIVRVKR